MDLDLDLELQKLNATTTTTGSGSSVFDELAFAPLQDSMALVPWWLSNAH